jgi:hypothetical protein
MDWRWGRARAHPWPQPCCPPPRPPPSPAARAARRPRSAPRRAPGATADANGAAAGAEPAVPSATAAAAAAVAVKAGEPQPAGGDGPAPKSHPLAVTEDIFGAEELVQELADPQALGKRGELYLGAQLLALLFVVWPPFRLAVGWLEGGEEGGLHQGRWHGGRGSAARLPRSGRGRGSRLHLRSTPTCPLLDRACLTSWRRVSGGLRGERAKNRVDPWQRGRMQAIGGCSEGARPCSVGQTRAPCNRHSSTAAPRAGRPSACALQSR